MYTTGLFSAVFTQPARLLYFQLAARLRLWSAGTKSVRSSGCTVSSNIGQEYDSSVTSKPSPRPCVIGCVLSTTVMCCGVMPKKPDCGCCTPRMLIGAPQSQAPPITSTYSGQLCTHDASA